MIGPLMICVSAVILLAGMLAGIVKGIKQDFALAPAHAHLNLVGGLVGIPIAGSLIVVAAMALFAVIVFRAAPG